MVMADLKRYATKVLREKHDVGGDTSVWAYHGSTQLLFTAQAVIDACRYVVEMQGDRQGIAGDVS